MSSDSERGLGQEILDGIREIKRGEHGRVINLPAVADIRAATGLSQTRFSELLGVSVRTLQDWEQGRRAPSGAARTLLAIAAKHPGHRFLAPAQPARGFAIWADKKTPRRLKRPAFLPAVVEGRTSLAGLQSHSDSPRDGSKRPRIRRVAV